MLPALAAAQYYPGQIVKSHAHSNAGQGGRLTDLDFIFTNAKNGATLTNVGAIISSNTWAGLAGNPYPNYEIRFSTLQGATGTQLITISSGMPASIPNNYWYAHGCPGTGMCFIPSQGNSYFTVAQVDESANVTGDYAFTVESKSGNVWTTGQIYMGGLPISTSPVTDTTKLLKAGDTMTGGLYSTSWINSLSSITASMGLYGVLTGSASLNVLKTGDTMTGPLTLDGSSLTIKGSDFSVGNSTFVIANGMVRINADVATAIELRIKSKGVSRYPVYMEDSGGNEIFSVLENASGIGNVKVPEGIFSIGTSTFVTTNGKIGIGTASPDSPLEIFKNNNNTGIHIRGNNAASGGGYIYSSNSNTIGLSGGIDLSTGVYVAKATAGGIIVMSGGSFDIYSSTGNTIGAAAANISRFTVAPTGEVTVNTGPFRPLAKTAAQLQSMTPGAEGEEYYCSTCSPKKIVVSTGTSVGNWAASNGGTFE